MNTLFRNRETLGGALFALLGVYLLWEISTFTVPMEKVRSLGPEFFPNVLAWALTLLSAALIVQGLRLPPAPIIPAAYRGRTGLRPLSILLGLASFIFLVEPLGFVLWALLFLALVQYVLGERRPFALTALSVLITAVLYLVFVVALNVPLPRGLLPF